jgi:hypothetical protein
VWKHGKGRALESTRYCRLVTVASRLKILQNNTKPAELKSDWPGNFGGHTAANFGQKRPKKILILILAFVSN